MNTPLNFQLKGNGTWWVDILLYFSVSLLISVVFCYVIFLVEDNKLKDQIAKEDVALKEIGTTEQKEREKEVLNYQSKINAFSSLLKNHEFTSNAFAFIEEETNQNVWFKQITLDSKARTVQLSCEADNMNAFAKQVASLENNKYIKSMGTLNSTIGESARISFNLYLTLDPIIFNYLSTKSATSKSASSSGATKADKKQPVTNGEITNGNNSIINPLNPQINPQNAIK